MQPFRSRLEASSQPRWKRRPHHGWVDINLIQDDVLAMWATTALLRCEPCPFLLFPALCIVPWTHQAGIPLEDCLHASPASILLSRHHVKETCRASSYLNVVFGSMASDDLFCSLHPESPRLGRPSQIKGASQRNSRVVTSYLFFDEDPFLPRNPHFDPPAASGPDVRARNKASFLVFPGM